MINLLVCSTSMFSVVRRFLDASNAGFRSNFEVGILDGVDNMVVDLRGSG